MRKFQSEYSISDSGSWDDESVGSESSSMETDEVFSKVIISKQFKNKSKHKDWREYYSDGDAAFVAERWGREIDAFGYTFDDAG